MRPYDPDSPWDFEPGLTYLTHGTYGACPRPVLEHQRALLAELESNAIRFLTRDLEARWDAARAAIAAFLNADPEGLVGVPNATTGVATVLELARVWAQAEPRPRRSIIFAAVAAEEQGLLGSELYGQHPTVPAGKIALGVNLDALYLFGKVRDVTMIGAEQTTFYPTVQRVASALGLRITPDQAPEQGSYYRSDHFSFARVGIPAFSIKQGHDIIGKPEEWGIARAKEYRDKRYHQPSDEFDPSWDFSSATQIGQLAFWLGWEAANAKELPNWLPGEEFRAVRDRSQQPQ